MLVLHDGEVGGERGAEHHGEEDEAALLGVEGVRDGEDEGEGGEGHVEDGPGEGDPEGEEEDDWLGAEKFCEVC